MAEHQNRFALLFGVSEFDDFAPIPWIFGDIEGTDGHPGLADVLSKHLGRLSFDIIEKQVGRISTKDLQRSLWAALDKLAEDGKDNEDSLVLVYYSGHGAQSAYEDRDNLLLAASDTEGTEALLGLRFSTLIQKLNSLKSSVICVLDCCDSGSAIETISRLPGLKPNLSVLASCASAQASYSSADGRQSSFTEFLISALLGQESSAVHNRRVTVSSLIQAATIMFGRGPQQPTCWPGDLEIVLAAPPAARLIGFASEPPNIDQLFTQQISDKLVDLAEEKDLSDPYYIYSLADHQYFRGSEPPEDRDLNEQPALACLNTWMEREDNPIALLFGDTGTGKSTTIRRFWMDQARKWLEDKQRPIPILLDLRAFGGVRLLEGGFAEGSSAATTSVAQERFRAIICDVLQNREGIPLLWPSLEKLCRDGRLLLILDGLDEMDVEGARGTAPANFSLFLDLLRPGGKMLLSCRSHYLRADDELRTPILKWQPRAVEIELIEIKPFTTSQVSSFLEHRVSDESISRWHAVKQSDTLRLLDLASVPFLLKELVPHLDSIMDEGRLRPSRLFRHYLDSWLRRDEWRFKRFFEDYGDVIAHSRAQFDQLLKGDERVSGLREWRHFVVVQFMEFVATDLWAGEKEVIHADTIQSILRARLPLSPDVFIAFFEYIIRTCSFFVRRGSYYTFIRPSVQEYLTARKFHNDIVRAEYPWDHSRARNARPLMRVPIELGQRRLSDRMADILVDTLRSEGAAARQRLRELIEETTARVEKSPETLYYLAGNCLTLYSRLSGGKIRGLTAPNLAGKRLNGVRLAGSNLTDVDLSKAYLDEADLRDVVFRGASLCGVQIHDSELAGADFGSVKINGGAIVSSVTGFDPQAAPENLREVYRLSNQKRGGRVFERPRSNLGEMVRIPGGVFNFGTGQDIAEEHERPPLPTKVRPFLLDKAPVTNGDFYEFVSANPEWKKEAVSDRFGIPYYLSYWRDDVPPDNIVDHPVVYVSWYAAEAYAAWRGKRLPNEVEWEFALRDGAHEQDWDYPLGPHYETGISPWIQIHADRDQGDEPATLSVKGKLAEERVSPQ